MAIVTGQTTLNATTATQLATGVASTTFVFRFSARAFVGPSTVTALNGLPVGPEDPPLHLALAAGEDLYAILAPSPETTTAKAYILKTPG